MDRAPALRTFVALLRGINVAGHNKVAMTDLRRVCERLGFVDVRTLLQSGNVVFQAPGHDTDELEGALAAEAKRRLRLEVPFFVRTAEQWTRLVARNPFPREAASDPGRLVVVFLKAAPTARAVAALRAAITGREYLEARGRELYVVYPDGMGRSRLTPDVYEKALAGPGTARNWNTVSKLSALAAG